MSRTNQGNQLTTHASWQKRFNVVFSIGRILSVHFGISMHGEKKHKIRWEFLDLDDQISLQYKSALKNVTLIISHVG